MAKRYRTLRGYLNGQHLSQVRLAAKLGVTPARISQILHGDPPGRDLAVKIEALTGIPVAAWSRPQPDPEPDEEPDGAAA